MKSPVIFLLVLFALASVNLQAQNDDHLFIEQVDTIITFNPDTYEESIQIIHRLVKGDAPQIIDSQLNIEDVQSDTIVYFDKETSKENRIIIQRKDQDNAGLSVPNIGNEMITDTIIVFDPETRKEEMTIITRNKETLTPAQIMNLGAVGEVQVDTVILFDPKTKKETQQIIRRIKKQ